MTSARRHAVLGVAALLSASPITAAAAQTGRGLEGFGTPATTPAPAPTPGATAVPIPAAPRIDLPAATPTPVATRKARPAVRVPTDRPAARERPTAIATLQPDAPRPVAKASPVPAATPAPIASPTPVATPVTTPMPEVVATPPAAVPTRATPVAAAPATAPDIGGWLIATAIVALLVGGLWLMSRRRRGAAGPEAAVVPRRPAPKSEPVPAATPIPVVVPPVADPRARLSIRLRPIRAGLNMLSATAECEITVTNIGDAPAEAIRVGVRLLGAHAGQEAEIADANAQPIMRAAVPPFALAPGESRALKVVSALSRAAMPSVSAGGRPMFVPLVAVNLLYATVERDGQTAQAFAIGIERVDSAKLSPLWLDQPPRMHDTVAARPHAAVVEQ